jgi:regulator of sigma D
MKGKVKLKLTDTNDGYNRYLNIWLKIENEWFFNYCDTVIDDAIRDDSNKRIRDKSKEEFYTDVVDFISDINNITKAGENLMKEIIKKKANKLKAESKENEALELLKKLNKPIEIEVKL